MVVQYASIHADDYCLAYFQPTAVEKDVSLEIDFYNQAKQK